jgi:TonB-dependent starch-binding outer membrane protein SusC
VYQIKTQAYLYNYIPGFFGPYYGANQPITVMDRWQKPGDVASVQKFSQNLNTLNAYSNARQSDQLYPDASYARLKNVSISWQLPKSWRQELHLQSARIFAQGQNLYTVTNYKGLDPETCFGESVHLPPLRVITFGVQLTL